MTANQKLYLKSLGVAALIETVVLIFTLIPLADGFMVHSAAGAAQRPLLTQFLGAVGFFFHLPSIILTIWFLPLAPLVQIFFLSGLVYLRYKLLENYSSRYKITEKKSSADKNSFENRVKNYSEKDDYSRKYWL